MICTHTPTPNSNFLAFGPTAHRGNYIIHTLHNTHSTQHHIQVQQSTQHTSFLRHDTRSYTHTHIHGQLHCGSSAVHSLLHCALLTNNTVSISEQIRFDYLIYHVCCISSVIHTSVSYCTPALPNISGHTTAIQCSDIDCNHSLPLYIQSPTLSFHA